MNILQRQVTSITMTSGGIGNAQIAELNNIEDGWKSSVRNSIMNIESGWRYFIYTRGLPQVDLKIVKGNAYDRRTWYLSTEPDEAAYNNLLRLPRST